MYAPLKKIPVFTKFDFCEATLFGSLLAPMGVMTAIIISQTALQAGIDNAMDDIELVKSFNDSRIIEEITDCTEKSAAEIVAETQIISRQNNIGYNVDVTSPTIVSGDAATATETFEKCAANAIGHANFEMAKAEALDNQPIPLKTIPLSVVLGALTFLAGFSFVAKMNIADNKWHNKWLDDWEKREQRWKEADDRRAKQAQNQPAPDHA